ncbi:MAG TPA: hypothetical protein VN784_05745 [Candidatus Limnocylindrales bacterium]|nr:hypothetical protein [Candidatus Limnocylindrales bacterium]
MNNEPTHVGCYNKRRARSGIIAIWILSALIELGLFAVARAQSNVVGHASDFTSAEYYPAPNQQQMKSRLSGAEAQPLPGGLLAIKQLKLETFGPDGKSEIVVNAPECVYDQLSGTASSAGRLQVQYQGKIRVAGEGFLWRQSDSFLTISNRISTVLQFGSEQIN